MIITIQMKLLLETRSDHSPRNSRSLPHYEYKSESLKFRINQHLQGYKMIKVHRKLRDLPNTMILGVCQSNEALLHT